MRSQNRWTGMVVGVVMGVLFSAAVVLAGNLEPIAGPTEAGSQGQSSIYSPIVLKTGDSSRTGVPRTGQTTSYGDRDDGALQKGVAWPNPRFTDNGNGTVTDNLTGLIWLKNANCSWAKDWGTALSDVNSLASGSCGLSDGSKAGQWRLPNVKELQSLIDFAYSYPALSNAVGTGQWVEGNPFIDVESGGYWSSTTRAYKTAEALYVTLDSGLVFTSNKTTSTSFLWPVRDGQ